MYDDLRNSHRVHRMNVLEAQPTVLVADDEPSTVLWLSHHLRAEGYTVLTAANGHEAIEQAHKHDAAVDLLLTDIQMPGVTGIELAYQMFQDMANLRVMFMSANCDNPVHLFHGLVCPSRLQFMTKPLCSINLVQQMQTLLLN